MSLIRNETQTALGELHIAFMHSADCYRHTAKFPEDPSVEKQLVKIANRRDKLAARVAEAIRATGDMPSEPDADLETGEQLLGRLRSLFSADQIRDVIEQRRNADEDLAVRLNGREVKSLERNYGDLLADSRTEVQATIAELEKL